MVFGGITERVTTKFNNCGQTVYKAFDFHYFFYFRPTLKKLPKLMDKINLIYSH